jgi:hypothetical protein
MDKKQKMEHLHNLVSFVSRKRDFVQENLHFLDAFFMFRKAQNDCSVIWIEEDSFINAIEDNYEFSEEEIDLLLQKFFSFAYLMNEYIYGFKANHWEDQWEKLDYLDDGLDTILIGNAEIEEE